MNGLLWYRTVVAHHIHFTSPVCGSLSSCCGGPFECGHHHRHIHRRRHRNTITGCPILLLCLLMTGHVWNKNVFINSLVQPIWYPCFSSDLFLPVMYIRKDQSFTSFPCVNRRTSPLACVKKLYRFESFARNALLSFQFSRLILTCCRKILLCWILQSPVRNITPRPRPLVGYRALYHVELNWCVETNLYIDAV